MFIVNIDIIEGKLNVFLSDVRVKQAALRNNGYPRSIALNVKKVGDPCSKQTRVCGAEVMLLLHHGS